MQGGSPSSAVVNKQVVSSISTLPVSIWEASAGCKVASQLGETSLVVGETHRQSVVG